MNQDRQELSQSKERFPKLNQGLIDLLDASLNQTIGDLYKNYGEKRLNKNESTKEFIDNLYFLGETIDSENPSIYVVRRQQLVNANRYMITLSPLDRISIMNDDPNNPDLDYGKGPVKEASIIISSNIFLNKHLRHNRTPLDILSSSGYSVKFLTEESYLTNPTDKHPKTDRLAGVNIRISQDSSASALLEVYKEFIEFIEYKPPEDIEYFQVNPEVLSYLSGLKLPIPY
jgi:hypothetical protein